MTTLVEREKLCRAMVMKLPLGVCVFPGNDLFDSLYEAFMPIAYRDTIRCARRIIKRNCSILQVKRDECHRWRVVSWRQWVGYKRPNPLPGAYRHAVRMQISKWKRANTRLECAICKTVHGPWHIDHHAVSFKHLVQRFEAHMMSKGHTPPDTSAIVYCKYHVMFKRASHSAWKRSWQRFHQKHATFQRLCRRCNLTKPKR